MAIPARPWSHVERRLAGALALLAVLALAAPGRAQDPAEAAPAPAPATATAPPTSEAPAVPGNALTLAESTRLALANSPDVVAAQRAVEAARAGVDVARQRPNPELTYERDKDAPHDAATLGLAIETGGKRARRVQLAEASVRLAEAELARAEQDVRQQVRRAYFGLAGAERIAALRAQQQGLAGRVRDAAQARFESGDRPQLDLVQAQLALAQAEIDADAARGNARAALATLDVLLGRPAGTPLELSSDPLAAPLPSAPALTSLAVTASAELQRAQQQIEEQAARLALVRAQQLPDLTLAPTLTHDALPDYLWGWRAAITLAVPLFHNHRAEAEVERRTLEQRQAELAAARRRVEGEVARTLALAESARHAALLYGERILPQSEEVERMAEDAYRSGQTGVEALLQSLQAVRETRSKAIQASIDYQAALADLEQAIGAPLP